MSQKNKGRPKRRGDRQPGAHGDPQSGRPQDHKGGRKGGQRDRRPEARANERPHAMKQDGSGAPKGRREGAARFAASAGAERPQAWKAHGKRSRAGFEAHKPPHGAAAEHREDGAAPDARPERRDGKAPQPERLWIYGRHAVAAAIANPKRKIKRILVNDSALDWIGEIRAPRERLASLTKVTADRLDAALHTGAVHQGVAAEVEDLPRARLKEDCRPDGMRPVVVLDQITDPHNIGAIIRSAAAFNARAIIVQERRTPPLAGALAKAAAGAVELLPCVQAVNIARALDGLKSLGYFCAGLAGDTAAPISSLPKDRPVALVLGAEGAGLRKLVRETCDGVYAIPIARGIDSLNVSNAAAVAFYELARMRT